LGGQSAGVVARGPLAAREAGRRTLGTRVLLSASLRSGAAAHCGREETDFEQGREETGVFGRVRKDRWRDAFWKPLVVVGEVHRDRQILEIEASFCRSACPDTPVRDV